MQNKIRHGVFWPTFLVLTVAVVGSYMNLDVFLARAKTINDAVLQGFAWLFSLSSLYLLILAVAVYLSPLGRIRIGGEDATPLLSKTRWFATTLCTTLAVGVVFWTTAEPLYHLYEPPVSLGLQPGSSEAALFAMSTMFLHWSFTPYAIYAVPAMIFAVSFYNLRLDFSISSMFYPLLGKRIMPFSGLIDSLALYSLVLGMASTLGTGALTLAGGIGQFFEGSTTTPLLLALIISVIVVTFVVSAASGVRKGIARLSAVNTWLLMALGLFVFISGPTVFVLRLGVESFGIFADNFFSRSLFTGAAGDDEWANTWSIFYWTIWFAWAPIAALFLGKISLGYTIREFLRINLLYPALFALFWVMIFSGTALFLQMTAEVDLFEVLTSRGVEFVLYAMFNELPLTSVWVPLLLFIAFISYVTAADSQTDAIGNLCTRSMKANSDLNAGLPIKVLWGAVVGTVSWVMVSFTGINGVKMLSSVGALPAMFIVLFASCSVWIWFRSPDSAQNIKTTAST